ncbi:MAG TPA: Crp/Fnr family transcriptional regulator [Thermoanaerobaculaceae bacterium]|nr:Crp/Fnr family transcriptional regulator [Thermoanaerobaculaceae bacterium]
MDIRHVIDQAVFLRDMPEEVRAALAGHARLRCYRSGEYLWRVGDRLDSLQVVAEGLVQIGIMGPEGDEIVLHVEPRGGCLGEPSIYSPEGDRRTDGRAFGRTTIVEVPGEKVRGVLEACPEAMRVFVRRVSEIARGHSRRIALNAFHDARGRLARLLLDLADSHGVPTARGRSIELPLSQRTLAGLIGVRRESVNRLIAALEREGALMFQDGTVTVLRPRLLLASLGVEALFP